MSKPKRSSKPVPTIAAAKSQEVLQAAGDRTKGLNADSVLENGAAFRTAVNKKIDEIAQAVQGRLGDVAALDVVIADKKAEIARLAGIDANLELLDTKIAELEAEIETLEGKRTAQLQEIADEEAARVARVKAEDATLALARKQEKEQYDYNTAKTRRDVEDAFKADLEKRKREEAIRREDWDRLVAREKAEHEALMASGNIEKIKEDLRVAFAAQLANELAAQKADLTEKARDNERILKAQISEVMARAGALDTLLTNANKELERLRSENAAAGGRLENIATKAVDGAAAREGFANRAVESALTASQPVAPRTR